jgi:glycosyltransferase involved in cell wall biosynthesis
MSRRILIYLKSFYPAAGGIEQLFWLLCNEFAREGQEVRVITQTKADYSKAPFIVRIKPRFLTMLRDYYWSTVFLMPNLSLGVFWLVLFNPFKKIVVSHNTWYQRSDGSKIWKDHLKLFLCRFVHNISVSKQIADHLPVISSVIYNCYNNKFFHPLYPWEQRMNTFLFVGRLVSAKGADLLIEAVALLKQQGIGINCVFVGDGPERRKLDKLVMEKGLKSSIEFLGIQSGEQLNLIMNKYKVLVIPSRWVEPFGIVALEGLAAGCLVVASDNCGLEEALQKFGLYFERNNSVSLSSRLSKLPLEIYPLNRDDVNTYLLQRTPDIVAKKYLELL